MPDTMTFPSNAAIDGVKAASLRPHLLIDWVGSGVYFEVRRTREWWIGSKAVGAAHLPGQVGGSSFCGLAWRGWVGHRTNARRIERSLYFESMSNYLNQGNPRDEFGPRSIPIETGTSWAAVEVERTGARNRRGRLLHLGEGGPSSRA